MTEADRKAAAALEKTADIVRRLEKARELTVRCRGGEEPDHD